MAHSQLVMVLIFTSESIMHAAGMINNVAPTKVSHTSYLSETAPTIE